MNRPMEYRNCSKRRQSQGSHDLHLSKYLKHTYGFTVVAITMVAGLGYSDNQVLVSKQDLIRVVATTYSDGSCGHAKHYSAQQVYFNAELVDITTSRSLLQGIYS